MSHSTTVAVISTALVAVISTGIGVYILRKNRRNWRVPTQWKHVGNVINLYIFPLKSARFIELKSVECTEVGFRLLKTSENPLQLRDRSFVIYGTEDRTIKSGRAIPSLVKIEISVHDENHIVLKAPNMKKEIVVKIPQRSNSNITFVKDCYGDNAEAIDCGDEVAEWLSQQISQKNTGYRLGFHDASKRRKFVKLMKAIEFYKNLTDAATGLFSDLTSIMIVNQASVDDCASKITSSDITHLSFRGNIIVDGPGLKPFDEDNWDWMKVGDVIMRNVKPCTRCVFTNVDPETGLRNPLKEPTNTLSTYRMSKGPENVPVMGIHMEVKGNGIIRCGDPVYVGCD